MAFKFTTQLTVLLILTMLPPALAKSNDNIKAFMVKVEEYMTVISSQADIIEETKASMQQQEAQIENLTMTVDTLLAQQSQGLDIFVDLQVPRKHFPKLFFTNFMKLLVSLIEDH